MRFSLTDMLWTIGLLSAASAGMAAVEQLTDSQCRESAWAMWPTAALAITAPLWLCAGLAAPFRRKAKGFAIGLVAWIGWCIALGAMLLLK